MCAVLMLRKLHNMQVWHAFRVLLEDMDLHLVQAVKVPQFNPGTATRSVVSVKLPWQRFREGTCIFAYSKASFLQPDLLLMHFKINTTLYWYQIPRNCLLSGQAAPSPTS